MDRLEDAVDAERHEQVAGSRRGLYEDPGQVLLVPEDGREVFGGLEVRHHGKRGDVGGGFEVDGDDGAVRLHLVGFSVNGNHLAPHVPERAESVVAVGEECFEGEAVFGNAVDEGGDDGVLVYFIWRHCHVF